MMTSVTTFARRIVSIAVMCGIATTIGIARPIANKRDQPSSLRCQDPRLTRLAEQGLARSATLRALVAQLERAHVIVYARISDRLATGIGGRTRLIGAGDGWRFIQIDIDDRWPKADVLSMLGHELQHAVEIADAPEVIDEESLLALYERIGVFKDTRTGPNRTALETSAAIEIERRVFSELLGDRW